MIKKRMSAQDARRFQEIAEILDISIDEAQELSSMVTSTMKEIKTDFDHPNINELIQNLANEKSLIEAIK